MLPWAEKYRPKSFKDVVDQEEAKHVLASWLCTRFKAPRAFCDAWGRRKDKEVMEAKAVLLAGPPGVGKTTLVHALAHEVGYELVELNASDVRTAERIRQVVGRGLRESSLFGMAGKLILFDEVDGLHAEEDQGGLESLVELVETARVPIVMTANNPYENRLRPLREAAMVVNLRRLGERDVVTVLRSICEREKIKCEEEALRAIAKSSLGDLRAAINDLQMYATGRRVLTLDDVKRAGERNPQYSMFEVLDKVFRARWFSEAREVSFASSFDWEQYFLWVSENIPVAYKDVEVMAQAYDRLSRADMVLGRMKRRGEWDVMPYMLELALTGVALVKEKPKVAPFTRYSFPQRVMLMSRYREARRRREALLEYLKTLHHVSRSYVASELAYVLSFLARRDERVLAGLAKTLNMNVIDVKDVL